MGGGGTTHGLVFLPQYMGWGEKSVPMAKHIDFWDCFSMAGAFLFTGKIW